MGNLPHVRLWLLRRLLLRMQAGSSRCLDSRATRTATTTGSGAATTCASRITYATGANCVLSPSASCSNIGAQRCSPQSANTLQRCSENYLWADYTSCPLGCSSGACKACNYGDTKCSDAFTYVSCGSGGPVGNPDLLPLTASRAHTAHARSRRRQPAAQRSRALLPIRPNMVQVCGDTLVT